MTIWNSGTLNFDKPISDETVAAIIDILKPTNHDIEVSKVDISFDEYYRLDLADELRQITALLAESATRMYGRVNYFGDYEGCYDAHDGIVEELSVSEAAIYDASDEALSRELRRRGYDVRKTNGKAVEV